jgi:hypothetical protein
LIQALCTTISHYAEYRIIVIVVEPTPDLLDPIDLKLNLIVHEITTDASIGWN